MKIRRQHPIGPYIVDFYGDAAKLIIELDGEIHLTEESRKHDFNRSEYLMRRGLRIVRFTNREVMETLDRVIEDILLLLNEPVK